MSRIENWRNRGSFLRLEGEQCEQCNGIIFPPRDLCPHCESVTKNISRLSGIGKIYSYTLLMNDHVPTQFKDQAPLVIALVKLVEGPLITAQLTDLEPVDPVENNGFPYKVEIDMEVEMVTRKVSEEGQEGIINYGYKFRPPILSSK